MSGFGHTEIASLIPHRYPFQLVDRVLEFEADERIVGLKNVTLNEPFFQGHFPELPVMPGVLICEALAQTGGLLVYRSGTGVVEGGVLALTGIDKAKFRKTVVPGDQLRLEVSITKTRPPIWKFQGRALVDGKLAAEAEFSLTQTEAAKARR